MPGILPMKVIKVGMSNQARIAQACDRCRSKKIRCDGIRPSCTQCQNVGFECKTSDKLSRRAFPRGYTESLEERVRCLEAEVRDLKDLLDAKDEKIDMLSRIRSHSPQTWMTPPRTSSMASAVDSPEASHHPDKDDVFKLVHPSRLVADGEITYVAGPSCGRALIDAFNQKTRARGRACPDAAPVDFSVKEVQSQACVTPPSPAAPRSPSRASKAPPRMLADQLVNIFLQEWAPLFPIVHSRTFLNSYEHFISNPDGLHDPIPIVQLNLVFGIATLSSTSCDSSHLDSFERNWQSALTNVLLQNSVATVQCLALAQIYCLLKADQASLARYRGLAAGLSQRLGLHQSQKAFSLNVLATETRKRVFWTVYTLDCFSAAQLGLPRLLKDSDIHCEYPVDADDDYVTEQGFLQTLPGESTKVSSAIALFRASRILARVLTELYPTSSSQDFSLKTISNLADELDVWSNSLPPHLRLVFAQDKPSTNLTGSRSPILSLAHHYIRSLIHRPAVCAASTIRDRASSSVVALATSSKNILQILQLLDERSLGFSLCFNRNELITLAGFGLLFQAVDLDQDGTLIKDSRKLLATAADMLDRCRSPNASAFRRLGTSLMLLGPLINSPKRQGHSHSKADDSMPAPERPCQAAHEQIKAIAARLSIASRGSRPGLLSSRRATAPVLGLAIGPLGNHMNSSQASITSIHAEPNAPRSEPTLSPLMQRDPIVRPESARRASPKTIPNLDYVAFSQAPMGSPPVGQLTLSRSQSGGVLMKHEQHAGPTDWERLLGSLDNGQTNIYDNIYGGPHVEALADGVSLPGDVHWPVDAWEMEHIDMAGVPQPPVPRSVMSFSDESLTSGEEWVSVHGSSALDASYPALALPSCSLDGLDGGFGL